MPVLVPRYQALLNPIRSFVAEYGVNGFTLRIRAGFRFHFDPPLTIAKLFDHVTHWLI